MIINATLVYGYKDGMGLLMDVMTPRENRNRAAVLWVLSQSMRSNLGFADNARGLLSVSLRDAFNRSTQCLLDAGYVVFAVAHSSTPKYRIDEIIPDIARAVRFVRYHADRFGIDANRIGVIGDASGALALVGTVSSAANPESEDPIDDESNQVQAVVVHCPGSDLLNFGRPDTLPEEFWGRSHPFSDFHAWDEEAQRFERIVDSETTRELLRQCSPITHLNPDSPPTLLLHGDQDDLIPLQQSELYAARLLELEVPHKLIVAKGEGHGWDPSKEELSEIRGWFDRYLFADVS